MSWNPYAFIEFEDLPAQVQMDFSEHVIFNDGISTRYLKPGSLEVQEGGFGETFVNFAGYKIQVAKELITTDLRIPEDQREYRVKF